jgi:hypothetical protein
VRREEALFAQQVGQSFPANLSTPVAISRFRLSGVKEITGFDFMGFFFQIEISYLEKQNASTQFNRSEQNELRIGN